MINDIRERVERVFENFVLYGYEISDTSTFQEMGLDSLDKIEVAMDLEHEFDVDIYDEELMHFSDFGDVVEYITIRLK